jgi:hypothetical protein
VLFLNSHSPHTARNVGTAVVDEYLDTPEIITCWIQIAASLYQLITLDPQCTQSTGVI